MSSPKSAVMFLDCQNCEPKLTLFLYMLPNLVHSSVANENDFFFKSIFEISKLLNTGGTVLSLHNMQVTTEGALQPVSHPEQRCGWKGTRRWYKIQSSALPCVWFLP